MKVCFVTFGIDGPVLFINEHLLQPQVLQNLAKEHSFFDSGFDFASGFVPTPAERWPLERQPVFAVSETQSEKTARPAKPKVREVEKVIALKVPCLQNLEAQMRQAFPQLLAITSQQLDFGFAAVLHAGVRRCP
jgi:hypothetical protein